MLLISSIQHGATTNVTELAIELSASFSIFVWGSGSHISDILIVRYASLLETQKLI